MKEVKFPEIGSRFVHKDAPPKGAEVRQVFRHYKKFEGFAEDYVGSIPVKNISNPDQYSNSIKLDDFNKNYKLI